MNSVDRSASPPMPAAPSYGTITALFRAMAEKYAGKVIFRQKCFGIWEETLWDGFADTAREVALGLIHLGLAPGETAAVLSNTRRE